MSRRLRDGGSSGSEIFVTTLRNFDRVKKKKAHWKVKAGLLLTCKYISRMEMKDTQHSTAIPVYQKSQQNVHFCYNFIVLDFPFKKYRSKILVEEKACRNASLFIYVNSYISFRKILIFRTNISYAQKQAPP